jgi:GT2 family glycosyltransferase
MVRTAIIVVTYNSERFLDDLFESLDAYTDWSTTRLLIVDNASADGTRGRLERKAATAPYIELLPQGTNLGFTGGNNIGLARARSLGARYALLLNPDTVVTDGWLSALEHVLDDGPNIGAAQPLLMLHDEPDRVNTAGNAIHFCGFGFCDNFRKHVDELGLDGAPRSVPYATGAALLLRLSALDRVGDFDQMLFLYHEDCDLQIRLRQAGYDCVVVPTSRVFHKYDASFSGAKYRWLERNRWMVMIKDWPTDVLIAASPVLAGVQAAVTVFAVRGGWFNELLRAHREVLAHLPELLAARARVQRARSADANEVAWFSGALRFEGLDHTIITRVANPLLSGYWRAVSALLPSTRAARRSAGAAAR